MHVDLGEWPVCLVRTGGVVYALRDECTHESVPLSEGVVVHGTIECWLHGSRFDLATVRCSHPRRPGRSLFLGSAQAAGMYSCGWARAGTARRDRAVGLVPARTARC